MSHPKGLIPIVVVIFIAVIAAGVVGAAWYFEENKDEANINQQRIDCEQRGGNLISGSAEYGIRCIVPHADAGQTCTSSDECQGDCVTNILSQLGVEGICQSNNDNQGCFTAIEEDKFECLMDDISFECSEESWGRTCDDFAKKTPDYVPKSDWQTYSNSDYGFSIAYPAEWVVEVSSYDPDADHPFSSDIIKIKNLVNDTVLHICPDERGQSCIATQDGLWDMEYRSLSIDGKQASIGVYTFDNLEECPTCTARNSVSFVLAPDGWKGNEHFLLIPGADNSFSELYEILSTFEFIEERVASITYIEKDWYMVEEVNNFSSDLLDKIITVKGSAGMITVMCTDDMPSSYCGGSLALKGDSTKLIVSRATGEYSQKAIGCDADLVNNITTCHPLEYGEDYLVSGILKEVSSNSFYSTEYSGHDFVLEIDRFSKVSDTVVEEQLYRERVTGGQTCEGNSDCYQYDISGTTNECTYGNLTGTTMRLSKDGDYSLFNQTERSCINNKCELNCNFFTTF